jgi:hypothetical protein
MRTAPIAICLTFLFPSILAAQTVTERLEKLEKDHQQLKEAYSKEIERLQFGSFVPALGESKFGLGPAASKVYAQDEGISIGGYGEFLYQQISGATDVFDALRTVLYVGYKFDEKWVFNSEIEYEHGSTSSSSGTSSGGGSASVEFSYLEYMACEGFNVRAGLLLVPMGFINEMHEPTTYLSAQRPETERRIIPTTWRETGLGIHGACGNLSYKSNVFTSLNGEEFDKKGLRGGRQKGNRSAADDFAYVGGLDWSCDCGFTVGASVFYGDTGQDGVHKEGTKTYKIPAMRTTIVEGHAQYQADGWFVRGLYASAFLENTGTFNMNTGENLAKRMHGYYGEVGYDVMKLVSSESTQTVMPYFRYEMIDTQAKMARGYMPDRTQKETILTLGVHYRPIDEVVIKADFQALDEGDDRFQISFGYVF